MTPTPEVQERLRRYLLGQLDDDDVREEIEKDLLANDEVFEELLVTEDEIIDEYLSGKLDDGERAAFESHFIATPERHDKLKFGRAFNRYLSAQAATVSAREKASSPALLGWTQTLFSSPLRIAVFAMIVIGILLGVWRIYFHQSDVDKGLLALNAAYREQRPVEARISALSYAPFTQTRGGQDNQRVDALARDRAELILNTAAADPRNAAAHHALGEVYLAKKEFDRAIEQFEVALGSDPNNPRILSDLGAVWLAKGEDNGDKEHRRKLEEFGRSLENLNKALQLNPNLMEALFNRALCLTNLALFVQAEKDWREYLKRDSVSGWADEARRKLKELDDQKQKSSSWIGTGLQDFINAYRAQDEETAWRIMNANREAITGRLISQQLVNAYLVSSLKADHGEANDLLKILTFAGKLDGERAADPFTMGIATFYNLQSFLSGTALAEAQDSLKEGYRLCLESRFGDALEHFKRAADLFKQAGDKPETILADYWQSYCYYQTTRTRESFDLLQRLTLSCEESGYKWLLAQASSLMANVQIALNEYTKGIDYSLKALSISEQIHDGYDTQKNLAQLAMQYRNLGDPEQSLTYVQRCLDLANDAWPGPRQMWRNYDTSARVFYSLGLYDASAAYSREALELALNDIKDPSMIYVSFVHLGLAYGQLKDYDQGVLHAQQGLNIGKAFSDSKVSKKIQAYSSLQLGYLYRQAGLTDKALESYDQAVFLYDQLSFDVFAYEAHKGRLLCYIQRNDDSSARVELQTVLGLFDRYRAKILDETNRDHFFDAEQSVYDLAIEFEFSRAGNPAQALTHSETSRARSLADSIKEAASENFNAATQPPGSEPFKLEEIQKQMPEQTQIVEYSVLDNDILIWVITKSHFSFSKQEIQSANLTEKVRHYLELVSSDSKEKDSERKRIATELYDLLIKPAELNKDKLLCFVPDKILNLLPFNTLVSPMSGRYLIEDFTIVYSPSANVFVLSSGLAQQKAGPTESALSVGNPSFDREAFSSLSDLPSEGIEAKEIARYYEPNRCLTEHQASRSQVLKEMETANIVHLASHYVVNQDYSMESKLLLAKEASDSSPNSRDGFLEVKDIYRLKSHRMRLVVLAGCRTGGERYYNGEGMIGFSRAFLAKGVPLVIASQWPVESNATATLMISFHKYRKVANLSSVDALKQAQVDMLNGPEERYRQPYYWAPFIATGGYSTF